MIEILTSFTLQSQLYATDWVQLPSDDFSHYVREFAEQREANATCGVR